MLGSLQRFRFDYPASITNLQTKRKADMTSKKQGGDLTLTRAQSKILDASEIIFAEPASDRDAAYLARQLVQATLPHTDPGDVPAWSRTNGNLTLTIQPGWDSKEKRSTGYPYGIIPRLLLFWMTTEALRTKSRFLELGPSLSKFMAALGLDPSRGGKRSDSARLKEQMLRLFRARITFEATVTQHGRTGDARRDMLVTEKSVLWWDTDETDQPPKWGSSIELSEKFYQAIIASAVPADIRAIKALRRSPLALDLYVWLTYEAWRVQRNKKARFVSWELLHAQFGAEYGRTTDFQQAARKALMKIKPVFPDLVLGRKRGGIEILPGSSPAIPPRG